MELRLFSNLRTRAYCAASTFYGWIRQGGYARPGLRILTYHAVGTPVNGDDGRLYNMSFGQFEMHMRHIATHHRIQVGTYRDTPPVAGSTSIAVTFDDGYLDNLTMAAPLLVELGIPFAIFVSTAPVMARESGFLGPQEVRELASLPGVDIGAHSVSHPRLTECNDRVLDEELRGSRACLEDLIGRKVDSLAYPHGAVDRRVRDRAEAAGYLFGVTTRFDINRLGRDPLLLCRTDMWAGDNEAVLIQKLQGNWDWYRWRRSDPAQG